VDTCFSVSHMSVLVGSADGMSDDSEDVQTPASRCGHSSYIGHVVDELISTERAYVSDLRDVVRVSPFSTCVPKEWRRHGVDCVDGALFLQPVKHRWPCPEHIMAKCAGPSNAENNANTNPNPNLNPNIYTAI